jgi:hypothetical protein
MIFPQSLTHLSLTKLNFEKNINQQIQELPKNLITINFCNYNMKVKKLPKNLKNIGFYFGNELQNKIKIHKNIKTITLSCNSNLINNLPKNIEKICFSNYVYKKINNLPLTIKKIVIQEESEIKNIKIPYGTIIKIRNAVKDLKFNSNNYINY